MHERLRDVPIDEREKILQGNISRIFGFSLGEIAMAQ